MIRRARSTDHHWISQVAAAAYADLGNYGEILPSWLGHPGVLAYLDEYSGTGDLAVGRGFTLLGFYQPDGEAGGVFVADLLAIAVEPKYRRQGIGGKLLAHAISVAQMAQRRDTRVVEMRLTVSETNQIGQRLFSRSGFVVLDSDHGTYDGGQRAIRMTRPLP